MSEITHFNKNGNPACPWERHKEICTVNDTGPLRVQSATQYATMLLGGASKDSMTVCSADLGGRPVPKTFDTGFNPCIFET